MLLGIIIVLAIAAGIYYLYVRKTEVVVAEATKVTAEPAKCGCGRSVSGFCVGLHSLTEEEWKTHNDNPANFSKAIVVNPPGQAPIISMPVTVAEAVADVKAEITAIEAKVKKNVKKAVAKAETEVSEAVEKIKKPRKPRAPKQ